MSAASQPRGPVLSARGLDVTLPNGAPVVRGVDVDLFPGEVVSLLGPSGAGKTTILKALLTPEVLKGQGYVVRWRSRSLSAEPAFVPQRGALLDHLDVAGNIELAQAGAGAARDPHTWLGAVELDGSFAAPGREVSMLSGGQAQRVAVARTLAAGRQLLVLDEPSVGLDPLGVRLLARLLVTQARRQRVSVLLITHDLALAGGASDRILFLDVAHQRLIPADPGWRGPAELDSNDRRAARLAALEGSVEELLMAERPPSPAATKRRRLSLGLLAPVQVAVSALVHAMNPRLLPQATVVMWRAFAQALAKPFLFYATVGGLMGFTIPFAMVHLSAGLKEKSVLAVMGGSYILSLAPPLSAIVFAATSGSAINAWLGGLRLHGQVLALEGLGIPPQRYLWSPAWLALAASYAITVGIFIVAMVAGGWVLFAMYDVPHAVSRLTASFLDPAPDKLAPLLRGVWLVVAYVVALPSVIVAKASEPKSASDDVTRAMTSAVMRCTLFVVTMELVSVTVMYHFMGR